MEGKNWWYRPGMDKSRFIWSSTLRISFDCSWGAVAHGAVQRKFASWKTYKNSSFSPACLSCQVPYPLLIMSFLFIVGKSNHIYIHSLFARLAGMSPFDICIYQIVNDKLTFISHTFSYQFSYGNGCVLLECVFKVLVYDTPSPV